MMPFRFVLIVAMMVAVSGVSAAETVQRHVIVTGSGVVQIAPDMADITLGVQHQAKTAREAMQATSVALAAVVKGVQGLGVAAKDIQTSGISLNPVYERRNNSNQEPRLIGFSASNMITIKVRELAGLGELLDNVVNAGATNFRGLAFGLSDRSGALETARRAAVADAFAKARVYADAAGVELGEVISITESGSRSVLNNRIQMMEATGNAVPISPGELAISANIGLTIGLK